MPLISPLSITAVAVLVLLVNLIRRLSSPLNRVPGPTIARFTSLNLKLNELGANRTPYVHALHQKYGPVVRIGPNEVSFSSWPALKEIYCSVGSGYDKTEFYDLFKIYGKRYAGQARRLEAILTYGGRTMFTTLNKADVRVRKTRSSYHLTRVQHAKRKRIIADRYANTNIMRSVSLDGVQERSSKFVQRCISSGAKSADIFVSRH